MKIPSIFCDHMVLQQGRSVPIWGWADPGTVIEVVLCDWRQVATSDDNGKWRIYIPAHKPGGPYEIRITELNNGQQRTLHDVMFGEVWLCSGQSNMEMELHLTRGGYEETARAVYPQIRLFTVTKDAADEPQDDCGGQWEICLPEAAFHFSGVGYYFGRELYNSLKVPVGLINSSWGGTYAEAWTRLEAMEKEIELRPIVERYLPLRQSVIIKHAMDEYYKKRREWCEAVYLKDPGNKGEGFGWALPDFDDTDWKQITVPGFWEEVDPDMATVDGAVWFRRRVEIPPNWAGHDLKLCLGKIVDYDQTYFNGVKIGGVNADTPNAHMIKRCYHVPGELVRTGTVTIAVRVFDHWGKGGFNGVSAELNLRLAEDNREPPILLSGHWFYKCEYVVSSKEPSRTIPAPEIPAGPNTPNAPANLFNGMIKPLVPYGIAGVIWYQGENNVSRAYQYRKLLPTLIKDWRNNWQQGDFPFLIVQLSSWMQPEEQPLESDWAELREAQLYTSLKVPNCSLAVTIDIGDADDIHPANKEDVGKRLAFLALDKVYGKNIAYSGPVYKNMVVDKDCICISFYEADGRLKSLDGQPLRRFAIAGNDRRFVWANAVIQNDQVVVYSPQIPKPVSVRYAWESNPAGCNLGNMAGLPASPFRTDDWPGVTINKI